MHAHNNSHAHPAMTALYGCSIGQLAYLLASLCLCEQAGGGRELGFAPSTINRFNRRAGSSLMQQQGIRDIEAAEERQHGPHGAPHLITRLCSLWWGWCTRRQAAGSSSSAAAKRLIPSYGTTVRRWAALCMCLQSVVCGRINICDVVTCSSAAPAAARCQNPVALYL